MKRTVSIFVTLPVLALLLASCGKMPMPGSGNGRSIKLTVNGVGTKASPTTTSTITSFKISAYVTGSWREIQRGPSTPEFSAGLYTDPVGGALKNISVTGSNTAGWTIAGNSDASNPSFSWVNGVAMRFFAYSPASKGTLTLKKLDTSYDINYPFTYSALANNSDEVTSGNCEDIIFAYAQNTATFEDDPMDSNYGNLVSGSSDSIDLKFYHALAQIRFCVNPDEWSDLKLIYVKLVGPKSTTSGSSGYLGIASKGECTFTGPSTFTWDKTTLSNRYAYSQTFNGTSGISFSSGAPTGWTSGTYGTSPDVKPLYTCAGDVLLVIPQSLTDCAVEVAIQDGSTPVQILKGHLPPTDSTGSVYWDEGNYYTYKISTTGTRDDMSLSMTLVDWDERESYIPIG